MRANLYLPMFSHILDVCPRQENIITTNNDQSKMKICL